MDKETTHFGYQQVPVEEKQGKVNQVFHSVANNYDLMNDCMSFGIHRLWKKAMMHRSLIRKGQLVLDLAGGTGDLARAIADRVGEEGLVVLGDINGAMLNAGRDKCIDRGYSTQIRFAQMNGEQLPFPDNCFHHLTIGFGLRNITKKDKALQEMYRVLKPGGQALILEFSKPRSAIVNYLYDIYSFKVIPKLGELIASDRESYQYLA